MRILFCSQTHLSKELGASKVLIELAEEMEQLGWRCEMICPADIMPDNGTNARTGYAEYLRKYLHKHASQFDVVEYDHSHLPYPRSEFASHTLFVARSVLLAHHFNTVHIPGDAGLRSVIRAITIGRVEAARRRSERKRSHLTIVEADLVNVANTDDRAELTRCGIPAAKIALIPYGISRSRREFFDAVSSEPPNSLRVAFVGTFDNRKGATDLPEIVRAVCEALPQAEFKLMGTLQGSDQLLARFPTDLRVRIEVVPRYEPEQLPGLLASCSVGVFPSYVEGFGLGVLEMLAASVPVIAYNSPGPPMMLPPEYLVPRGDTKAASSKLINLLSETDQLKRARSWAKRRSHDFRWEVIAAETSRLYAENAEAKQRDAAVSV